MKQKNNSCSKKWFYIQSKKQTNSKNYSDVSHKNIHYYLKLQIPKMHRHFFLENYLKIEIIHKHIAMTEEICSILHVVNGIDIINHNVDSILLLNRLQIISIIIRIFVRISIIIFLLAQILFSQNLFQRYIVCHHD